MENLKVNFLGKDFKNPVIPASGTFGFGYEFSDLYDINILGSISIKGTTLEPRYGNKLPRIAECPSGLINAIGLQNPGVDKVVNEEIKKLAKVYKHQAIANVGGHSIYEYVETVKKFNECDEIFAVELNISCPNVATGGAAFGMSCSAAHTATKAVREVTKKPLIVKLTPQSPELIEVALNCIKAGADGISLCNSFQGVAIDIETGRPVFDKVKAGFGGPAVRPIAVRLVYELVQAINQLPEEQRVPVIAIGGISCWQDVVEFIMAGATAVEVGTNTFANPMTMIECIQGLEDFMQRKGYKNINEMKGIAQ